MLVWFFQTKRKVSELCEHKNGNWIHTIVVCLHSCCTWKSIPFRIFFLVFFSFFRSWVAVAVAVTIAVTMSLAVAVAVAFTLALACSLRIIFVIYKINPSRFGFFYFPRKVLCHVGLSWLTHVVTLILFVVLYAKNNAATLLTRHIHSLNIFFVN